jgi:hypothetical protein
LSAVTSAVVHDKISSFFNVAVIGNNAMEMPLPILLFLLFMFLLLSLSCFRDVVAAASFFTKKQLETHSKFHIFWLKQLSTVAAVVVVDKVIAFANVTGVIAIIEMLLPFLW